MVSSGPCMLSVLVTLVSVPSEQYHGLVLCCKRLRHLLAKSFASLLGNRYPNVTI